MTASPPPADLQKNPCERLVLGHSGQWGSERPTAALRKSAVVGAEVGSNGRLLRQAMAVPDPEEPLELLDSRHSGNPTTTAMGAGQNTFFRHAIDFNASKALVQTGYCYVYFCML